MLETLNLCCLAKKFATLLACPMLAWVGGPTETQVMPVDLSFVSDQDVLGALRPICLTTAWFKHGSLYMPVAEANGRHISASSLNV